MQRGLFIAMSSRTERGEARRIERATPPRRMIRELKVKDVMTKAVLTVSPDTSVKMLWELFKKHDFNAFPVVKGGRLVGIVTKLDFMRVFGLGIHLSRRDYWNLFANDVEDIMRTGVITVRPDDTLKTAVEYMIQFSLRSIPVADGKKLVGIVSRNDLIEHLIPEQE